MLINEESGTYSAIFRRALNPQRLGRRTKIPVANDPARSNYLYGRRRGFESRHRTDSSNFPSNRSTLASTVPFASSGRSRKRCSAPWPISENYATQNQCCCRGNSSYNSCRCDPLEHANNGQSPRTERGQCSSHMAQTQFETASCRNFQAQPGQTIYRETARCRWSLFKSPRQSNRFMCRREKPDSGVGTHSSANALASGDSGPSNARLHATWDYDVIRRFKHARWSSDRRLYASPSASRIYSLFTTHQRQDSSISGLAPYRRQLWNTQASTRSEMAETPSTVPFSLCSDIQLLAQYGGTLVRRNYKETHTSRIF